MEARTARLEALKRRGWFTATQPFGVALVEGRRSCVRRLRAHFDTVLLDSPPVLAVTGEAVLAPRVDGTILVAKAGATSRRAVIRAMEIFDQVDGKVVGTVLNEIPPATDGYYQAPGYGAYQSVNNEPVT